MSYSTFLGLETARRGLSTARTGMDVTGHNIANASTPGYTRQRALQQASYPYTVPSLVRPGQAGQLGTGVTTTEMQRIRNNFLDGQLRVEIDKLGAWQTQNDALSEIETIFMEPSNSGLNTLFANFWSSWQELSKNAENSPIRTALAQNAVSLANGLNHTNSQLETVRGNLDQLLQIYINDINSKALQIAGLNKQIINIKAIGDQPNDLLDRRDLLLDELAKLTSYTVSDNADGSIVLSVGSLVLADGGANPDVMPGSPDWSEVTSGALTGINQARTKLEGYRTLLDNLAVSIMSSVNAIHRTGFDLNGDAGEDFFVLSGATGRASGDIRVNSALINDVSKVAAALNAAGLPGDGNNALAIARLQNQNIVAGTTCDNYYKNLIARLGVDTQESARMVLNQQALVDQLGKRRESVSGVSLDEEMTSMIQYQYAYQAAARMITTLDEMLNTLINRMAV